jgi:hypothetical protein
MKFVAVAQEKLGSAKKFRPTDSSLSLALGEGLAAVADRFSNNSNTQQHVCFSSVRMLVFPCS